ncbi:hypothetical protein BBJ28_00003767 [Nothophytophthora sp. Chile5]|nr:hypothetical protein BBJ28_00003767 [Nothophytophthora sp. Chile5]
MGREGGEKRKKSWRGGRDGDQKRHKGALGAATNAKGHSAVLVTCDKTKERQSVRDALNILNEAADKYFPLEKTTEDDEQEEAAAADSEAADDSVQKQLQAEIAALKTQAKSRQTGRFTPLDTGVKGAILIQFKDANVSPGELVAKIFEDVERTKEFSSRFIMRMIPLEKVGYSSVEAIKEMAGPLVQTHWEQFKAEQKANGTEAPLEFAVEFKRRNCTNLNSMDVINALVEVVGLENAKVNLTTPRSVVLVEVFRNTCGVSVVTDFHRYKKFNVRSVIDPPVPGKPTPPQSKKQEKQDEVQSEANVEATEEATGDAEKTEADAVESKTESKADEGSNEAEKET